MDKKEDKDMQKILEKEPRYFTDYHWERGKGFYKHCDCCGTYYRANRYSNDFGFEFTGGSPDYSFYWAKRGFCRKCAKKIMPKVIEAIGEACNYKEQHNEHKA